MTKVYNADLSKANASEMISQLEKTIETNKKLKGQVQAFNTESRQNLQGSGYDVLRQKLSFYEKSLDMGSTICENMISAIRSANNKMINFMEGYDMLDDSMIGEIKSSLDAAKQLLAWLESTHTETYTDPETGAVTSKEVKNGSDAEIENWKSIIAELERLLKKLQALAGEDKSDYADVQSVNTDVTAFAKAIGSPLSGTVMGRYGSYTIDELKSVTEEEVKSMSKEEFIDFVAAMAQQIYREKGGVLPSITIAQALEESGYGKSFEVGSNNVYGLIGYPPNKPKVNRLRQFDSFYEATEYHASYFEEYIEYYGEFLDLCNNNQPIDAAGLLWKYANGDQQYAANCQALIRQYDLTRFDSI